MSDKKISQLTAASTPLAGTEVLPIVQSGATTKVAVSDLTAGRTVLATALGLGSNPADYYSGTGLSVSTGNSTAITIANSTSTSNGFVYFADGTSGAAEYAGYIQYNHTNDYMILAAGAAEKIRIETGGDVKIANGNLVQGTAAKGVNFTANTSAAGMTSRLLNWYEEGTWTPNQGAGLTVVGAFSSAGTYTRIGRQVFVRGSVSGATSVAVAGAGIISTNLPYSAGADTTGVAINDANNASSDIRVSSATLTAITGIAATATITFSATYAV